MQPIASWKNMTSKKHTRYVVFSLVVLFLLLFVVRSPPSNSQLRGYDNRLIWKFPAIVRHFKLQHGPRISQTGDGGYHGDPADSRDYLKSTEIPPIVSNINQLTIEQIKKDTVNDWNLVNSTHNTKYGFNESFDQPPAESRLDVLPFQLGTESGTTSISGGTQTTTKTWTSEASTVTASNIPEDLMRLRPKILEELPIKFLPEYKNPCYLDVNKALTCLPYFFLLGLPKCGTSDLWSKIVGHRHIVSVRKEPHWFTRVSLNDEGTLSSYARRFITPAIEPHPDEKDRIISGDGSASTFWDNHDWVLRYPEYANEGPPYIIADVIKAVLPRAKFIVIYRDPATRLYSDFLYFGSRNKTAEHFHSEVVTTINNFTNCTRSGRSARACAYQRSGGVRLHIGLYSVFTRDWLARFPRDKFMFLELGDWHEGCKEILPKVHEFLEVEKLPSDEISAICDRSERNVNAAKKSIAGPMLNETKKLLHEFYRPYVFQLAKILGDRKLLWNYAL